jgi:glucose/arabinose dehydrogenase
MIPPASDTPARRGRIAFIVIFIALCCLLAELVILARPTSLATPILPAGFSAQVYARGLSFPTGMSWGPDGRLYLSERGGAIMAIRNHRAVRVAGGFTAAVGVTWYRGLLYVSSSGMISTLRPKKDFRAFVRHDIVRGLPVGRHQNDSLAFHAGWFYLGVGSTCNACRERDPRSATIMRFRPDGRGGQIYARGLRNPFGLAFQPDTGQLFATDNGRDDHDDRVPDELNRIVRGGNYGWPSCWGARGGSGCAGTLPPVLALEPHSSADGLTFYTGSTFPRSYWGDLFIAEWGASVGGYHGHVVLAVRLSHHGPTALDFATGLKHPITVINGPRGSLLIADYGTGVIWKVRWTGK